MEGYTLGEIIAILKTDLTEFIKTKMEYLKLEVYEKTSATGSFLVYGLIIMNLVFFALFAAFIALGFLIGQWVGSVAGGFGIVALFYIIILFVLYLCRKPVLRGLQNLFLKQLDKDLSDPYRYESEYRAPSGKSRMTQEDSKRKEDDYEC